MDSRAQAVRKRRWLSRLLWAAIFALAVRMLAAVPVHALTAVLRGIDPTRFAAILAVNVLILAAAPVRLWLLARGDGTNLPYVSLIFYRMASSAVGYVAPGPLVGGVPLQVVLLARRHRIARPEAAGLTVLERMIELAGSLSFLALGFALIAGKGGWRIGRALAPVAVVVAVALLPFAYGIALRSGRKPATALLARLRAPRGRAVDGVIRTEEALAGLWKRRPAAIALGLVTSYLLWVPIVLEYRLLLDTLGLRLTLRESIEALTLARAAVLSPIPGALAVLEAAQVIGLQRVGESAASGLALGLLIRARDLLFVLPGLAIAWLLRRGRLRALAR